MKLSFQYKLCLLLLIFSTSCSREDFLSPNATVKEPVSEAKIWVEKFVRQDINSNQRFSNRDFLWKQAVVKQTKEAISYVQVPLDDELLTTNVIYDAGTKIYISRPKLQAIIFTDIKKVKQLLIIEIIPTGEYAVSHQGFTADNDYSGLQLIYNWKGDFLRGGQYNSGNIINYISSSTNVYKNNRSQACEQWYAQYFQIGCTDYQDNVHVISTKIYYQAGSFPNVPGRPDLSDPLSYKICDGDGWRPGSIESFCVTKDNPNQPYNPFSPSNPSNPSNIFIPSPGSGPIALLELYNNKIGLFGPCPGLTDSWRGLIEFKPAKVVTDKLYRITQNPTFRQSIPSMGQLPQDWYVQSIQSATGVAINLDNFSVFMSDLPSINGHQLSVSEFVRYIRQNMNSFVDTQYAEFDVHHLTGENETGIWQSSNPLGAVVSINMFGPDNGSVIVSENNNGQESAGWVFNTIHDPWNGDHPVSGTRIFGCYETSGGYIFYTQGADRLTNYGQSLAGFLSKAALGQAAQFTGADRLWRSLQTKVANFVGAGGIYTEIRTPVTNRPRWADVKDALDNNRSLSTVPCY